MWKEKSALVALTITAIPIALVVVHGFKAQLPTGLQQAFGPTLSSAAWVLCGMTLLLSAVAVALQSRIVRSAVEKRGAGDPAKVKGARVGAFLATSSLTQIPPLFAVAIYMLGANLLPVGVAVAISSIAVCVLGIRI